MLVRALKNTHTQSNIVLEPQVEFSPVQVRKLKEFYEDFFDAPPKANEAKTLGKTTGESLQKTLQELEILAAEKAQFPFLNVLNQPIELLRTLVNKPYAFYLADLGRASDELLDIKDDVLDPIRRFMGGSMKSIYLDVGRFIEHERHNFADVEGEEVCQIEDILGDVDCYKGNSIQQAKALMQAVKQKVSDRLMVEKDKANVDIDAMRQKLMAMPEFTALSDIQKDKLLEPFSQIQRQVDNQSLIGMVRDDLRRFEQGVYSDLLSQVISLAQPEPEKPEPPVQAPDTGKKEVPEVAEPAPKPASKKIEVVNIHNLKVVSDKPLLTNVSDVDDYIEELRKTMLEEIANGKRVQV